MSIHIAICFVNKAMIAPLIAPAGEQCTGSPRPQPKPGSKPIRRAAACHHSSAPCLGGYMPTLPSVLPPPPWGMAAAVPCSPRGCWQRHGPWGGRALDLSQWLGQHPYRFFYSARSLIFAASFVCHCILLGLSAPPRLSVCTWSITYPGHAPELLPVDGHG